MTAIKPNLVATSMRCSNCWCNKNASNLRYTKCPNCGSTQLEYKTDIRIPDLIVDFSRENFSGAYFLNKDGTTSYKNCHGETSKVSIKGLLRHICALQNEGFNISVRK